MRGQNQGGNDKCRHQGMLNVRDSAQREASSDSIHVLLVGMGMYGQLLARELSRDQTFDVVEAGCEEVAEVLSHYRPHVVLIDAGWDNEMSKGFDIVRQLRILLPQTHVVLLLESNAPLTVESFRAGANGILSRGASLNILKKCICCVHRGQIWASTDQLRLVLDALRTTLPSQLVDFAGKPLLSRREQDVVRGIVEGMTNREIAEHLKLSVHTVKNYVFKIFETLGVSSRVEVILYAVSQASRSQPAVESSTDFVLGHLPLGENRSEAPHFQAERHG